VSCPINKVAFVRQLPDQLAFLKTRAKRSYLTHTGRASNAEKQPAGHGPEGCDENGPAGDPAAAGSVTYQSDMRPPRVPRPRDRRPILIATKATLFMGQDTR